MELDWSGECGPNSNMERVSMLPFDLTTGAFSRNARLWTLLTTSPTERSSSSLETLSQLLGVLSTQHLPVFQALRHSKSLLAVASQVQALSVPRAHTLFLQVAAS